jgi:hypothetical protein
MTQRSKRIVIYASIFLSGLIIGFGVSLGVVEKSISDLSGAGILLNISDLEKLTYDIYSTGDYQSSVVVLNYLINKLRMYEELSDRQDNLEILRTDRGLAHGRLYIVHRRRGEEEIGRKEYENAIMLLGPKYNIRTEDDLKDVIERIDKSKENEYR